MRLELVPATSDDEAWLEGLRRDVYQELFELTWGGWDETRHARHFKECVAKGGIFVVRKDGTPVGMIQLLDESDGVQVAEIQIAPASQNQGIGGQLLRDVIAQAHTRHRRVYLSLGLKNVRAFRLYQRLGFVHVGSNETHHHMSCDPPASS